MFQDSVERKIHSLSIDVIDFPNNYLQWCMKDGKDVETGSQMVLSKNKPMFDSEAMTYCFMHWLDVLRRLNSIKNQI